MILSCVKMVISINIKAIQKSLNKITTVQKTHKLWGRCPRPLDSPTSLSESEREAERTFRATPHNQLHRTPKSGKIKT